MQWRVLFVDDEPNVTKSLKRAFRKEPYDIVTAESADEALKILARKSVDVVISDEMMPGMSGSELLALVKKKYPETVRIMMTGHASLDLAIRAINEGQIYRFFTKPWNDVDLAVTIRHALQQKKLMAESRRLLEMAKTQYAILEDVERVHPGITQIDRDASGRIVIEEDDGDLDTLIRQMNREVKRSRSFLSPR